MQRIVTTPPARPRTDDAIAARRRSLSLRLPAWSAVCAPILLGLIVRLRYVLASGGFPLGDGGLFALMIRAVQQNGYRLPSSVVYNGQRLPFAYPPFGFYAGAIVADLSHADIYTVQLVLPLLVNVATIGAVYLFARAFFTARATALAATIAFAVIPLGFWFEIEGGGVTRSFGLLFAVLALWQLQRLYVERGRRQIVGAGLFAGLTALSHPEFALFVAESAIFLLLMRQQKRRGLRDGALAALVALAVAAPWLLVVLSRYGVRPLLQSSTTGNAGLNGLAAVSQFTVTQEQIFPVIAALAAAGACACYVTRRPLMVFWPVLLWLLDWRGGKMYGTVPLALLAGVGATEVLLPALRLVLARGLQPFAGEQRAPALDDRWRRFSYGLLIALVPIYGAISAMKLPTSYLAALPHADRAAMAWAGANLPADARVLVLGADERQQNIEWGTEVDRVAEWFPVLAQRPSVATYEGQEWVGQYYQRFRAWQASNDCTDRDAQCLDDWSRTYGLPFNAVYIAKGAGADTPDSAWCCWSLRNALRTDPRYRVVYDGPGATIAVRQG